MAFQLCSVGALIHSAVVIIRCVYSSGGSWIDHNSRNAADTRLGIDQDIPPSALSNIPVLVP